MADLLLAEELLLVALEDETGRDRAEWSLDAALAGALLLDLAAAGAVREEGKALVPDPAAGPGHPVLAAALDALRAADRPRDAKHWVGRLPRALKPLKERVAELLVERGVLSDERRKVLGLFPSRRFVEADPAPEREVRERLHAALVHGAEPEPRTAMLVALLEPTGLVERVVPGEHRREAKRRAKAIADRGVVGGAVDDAIQGVQAAVIGGMTAAVVASTATTTGGS